MLLTAQEETLIGVIRGLPPTEASKVLDWARPLSDLAGNRRIEWSDSWTDEDLADATAASVLHFEDQERDILESAQPLLGVFPVFIASNP